MAAMKCCEGRVGTLSSPEYFLFLHTLIESQEPEHNAIQNYSGVIPRLRFTPCKMAAHRTHDMVETVGDVYLGLNQEVTGDS